MTRCELAFSMQTVTRWCIPTCCECLEHMTTDCQVSVQKFSAM